MTETLQQEIPLCSLCGDPTESGILDPSLGTLCYPCRDAAAMADVALRAAGMNDLLSSPKNTPPETP